MRNYNLVKVIILEESLATSATTLAAMAGTADNATADFKSVWDLFKATRDNEIISALYKGAVGDAKKLADGVQRPSSQDVGHYVV